MTQLGPLTSAEAAGRAAAGAVLVVPVGSTEQHGPHLPLSTDADLAAALCAQLGESVVAAPLVPYGSSGEHEGFAGTISIGQQATELLLTELGRSATRTFPRVLLVSTHGGNTEAVRRAVARLRAESRDVSAWFPRWHGDAHAGRSETSLQLALAPATVRLDRAEAGNTTPITELMPALRTSAVHAVSPNGVLGDPDGASAREGGQIFTALLADLTDYLNRWPDGRP